MQDSFEEIPLIPSSRLLFQAQTSSESSPPKRKSHIQKSFWLCYLSKRTYVVLRVTRILFTAGVITIAVYQIRMPFYYMGTFTYQYREAAFITNCVVVSCPCPSN